MKLNFKLEGFDELARALNALPEAVGKKTLRFALKAAAEPIRSEASILARRAPGAPDIADNITTQVGRSGQSIAIGPAKGFAYGLPLEFGTVRHRPYPFMRPAFDGRAKTSLDVLSDELWWALRRGIPGRGGF